MTSETPLHNTYETAMRCACAAARQWLGATSPNPAVGAVALGTDGAILAVAAHCKAGEAHAEAKLIQFCCDNGLLEKLDTLVVTLEPCNHQGRTPPCVDAIIDSGIKRVVIGICDPNPHVTGGGVERLRQAGIEIITGIAANECAQLVAPYAYSVTSGTPWLTIKRAFDRLGSMIPAPGHKTFSAPYSLKLAHRLRKKADAILTGSGTVLADNPLFTVRHVPDIPGKRRWLALLDRRNRVPQSYDKRDAAGGLDVVRYPDVETALKDLGYKGVREILVEAGPALSQYLLERELWTMAVTVRQTDQDGQDNVTVDFNPRHPINFDPEKFSWDYFLPVD
jgi:diaminohydroxyphosphoribosylaminopyrimidine deaminase/5-amino-6-(5-phosphoribosylamino)uracil reductase